MFDIFLRKILLVASVLFTASLTSQEVWTAPDYLWEETELELDKEVDLRHYQFMTADENGFIWTARNRVQRYDGLKFEVVPGLDFQVTAGQDLSITPGPDGLIWLAHHSATGSYGFRSQFKNYAQYLIDPQTLETKSPAEYFRLNLPPVDFSEVINVFCQEGGADCYLGLLGGDLLRYYAGTWRLIESPDTCVDELLQHVSFADNDYRWVIYPGKAFVFDQLDNLIFQHQLSSPQYAMNKHVRLGHSLPHTQAAASFHKTRLPNIPAHYWREESGDLSLPPNKDGMIYRQSLDHETFASIIDREGREIVHFQNGQYDKLKLVDRIGRFWFATHKGFLVGKLRKRSISSFLDEPAELISVRALHSFKADSLRMNTYSGVFHVSYPSGHEKPVPGTILRNDNTFLGLTKDQEGNLLSGQHSGSLYVIDAQTGEARSEKVDSRNLNNTDINLVINTADRSLWALANIGAFYKHPEGRWRFLPAVDSVRYSYAEEEEEGLWLAGDRGLRLLDISTTEVIADFPALHSLAITHFSRHANTFYLATDKGVAIWEKGSAKYSIINLQVPGLPTNIHAVYRTENNILYFSSDHGIFRYNLTDGSHFKFTTQHGLPDNECNWLAHFQGEDGTLFFGTVKGGGYFHPDSIDLTFFDDPKAQLYWNRVELYRFEKGFYEIDLDWQDGKPTLLLTPDDVQLRIGVSLPHNPFINKARIRYQLVSSENPETWIFLEKGILQLNKPSPGEYLLRIDGVYPDGTAIVSPPAIRLIVQAPLYQRSWFITLMVSIVALLTAWIFHQRKALDLKRQFELEQKINAATERINQVNELIIKKNQRLLSLNNEKQKLLTVIAHDLKGPFNSLRGLSGKIDFLLRDADYRALGELSDDVESIVVKASSTLNNILLTNQPTKPSPQVVDVDLCEEFEEQVELLEPIARMRAVELQFSCSDEGCLVKGVKYSLNSMFRNLVLNAIQASEAGGAVVVKLGKCAERKNTLKVIDTGHGMKAEQVSRFLSPLSSADSWEPSEHSTGLGWRVIRMVAREHDAEINILSEPEEGTTVVISFASPTGITI